MSAGKGSKRSSAHRSATRSPRRAGEEDEGGNEASLSTDIRRVGLIPFGGRRRRRLHDGSALPVLDGAAGDRRKNQGRRIAFADPCMVNQLLEVQ